MCNLFYIFIYPTQNVGCIKDCLKLIVETPLCFPRFMFQSLQNTSIKVLNSDMAFRKKTFVIFFIFLYLVGSQSSSAGGR